MAIPDYQALMLPVLTSLADGAEYTARELRDFVAEKLNVTPAQRRELLPSGKQPVFNSRVGWAKTYLDKAGLLKTVRRGVYVITETGRSVLSENPAAIDNAFLARFESFRVFTSDTPSDEVPQEAAPASEAKATPSEQLENAYLQLRRQVEQDLRDQLLKASPAFFEEVVVEVLVAMGYGGSRDDAGKRIGRSGDGGLDGVINEDRLGLDTIYVQAKRWQNTVGRPEIQAFAGSLEGERARKGVFITTSTFSKEAREYVSRIDKRIVLLDGVQLSSLMFEHGVGVTSVASFEVKRIDGDYFVEE